jgi:hypothetical protein
MGKLKERRRKILGILIPKNSQKGVSSKMPENVVHGLYKQSKQQHIVSQYQNYHRSIFDK